MLKTHLPQKKPEIDCCLMVVADHSFWCDRDVSNDRYEDREIDRLRRRFFIGWSVLCATNTVVRSFFGQAILCSFCNPETQHFQKNNSFSFF